MPTGLAVDRGLEAEGPGAHAGRGAGCFEAAMRVGPLEGKLSLAEHIAGERDARGACAPER